MCLSEKKGIIKFLSVLIVIGSMAIVPFSAFAAQGPTAKPAAKNLPPDPENEFYLILKQSEELRADEAGLALLDRELDSRLKKLEQAESRIQQELKLINRVSDARVRRLIRIYSAMDSKSAARLMEGLDTGQAVDVLAGMKDNISGPILASMDAKTASRLIKLLAAYKGPAGPAQ